MSESQTDRTLQEVRAQYGNSNLTWEIAELFPVQGMWSEWEYMELRPNRVVEYDHGYVEIHDMPTSSHQLILAFLYQALLNVVSAKNLGIVLFAPLRIKLWEEKYREPDIVFMLAENLARAGEEFWLGADLVMEVVSRGTKDRERDLVKKREDYAKGNIPEYWIVDPEQDTITILKLEGDTYRVHGEFKSGAVATSVLLAGFSVTVTSVFAAAKK